MSNNRDEHYIFEQNVLETTHNNNDMQYWMQEVDPRAQQKTNLTLQGENVNNLSL